MNGRELSTYTDGNTSIQYKYNLDGIRTSKIINGVETKYYLEGRSIIFEKKNNSMIYYIYNGDELLGFKYDNNIYYYHKNVLGDIIGILDSNYNELVTYEYDSFGNIVSIIDNSNINLGTINPFRYRSYYYDEEIGLYYLNSRYYNPVTGRFINSDCIMNGQILTNYNLFDYCGNNPVNSIDKSGYTFKKIGKIFSSAIRKAKIITNNIVINSISMIEKFVGTSTSFTKTIKEIKKVDVIIPGYGGLEAGTNISVSQNISDDSFISINNEYNENGFSHGLKIGDVSGSVGVDFSDGIEASASLGIGKYSFGVSIGITSDFRLEIGGSFSVENDIYGGFSEITEHYVKASVNVVAAGAVVVGNAVGAAIGGVAETVSGFFSLFA